MCLGFPAQTILRCRHCKTSRQDRHKGARIGKRIASRLHAWPRSRSYSLARWSITFAPEAASLSEGLRAAAACAALAALAVLSGHVEISWAAVAAFWTCLVDPGGATGVRATVLISFTFTGAIISMLCASIANLGIGPSATLIFGLAMLAGALRIYGAEASTLSNLLLVDAVYTISRPLDSAPAVFYFGGLFLAGCIWASLLSLTVWRIHPFQPARAALAAAFQDLSSMAWSLAGLTASPAGEAAWRLHAQQHRRAVRESIEMARRRIAQVMRQRGGPGITASQFQGRLATADSVFAFMIALTDSLERRPATSELAQRHIARSLKRLAVVFQRLSSFVSERSGDPAPLESGLSRLEQGAFARQEREALIFACVQEVRDALDNPSDILTNNPLSSDGPSSVWARLIKPIRDELHWRSTNLRHALRLATAVTIAYILTRFLNLSYGYWMTMTVVIIMQPQLATTWARGLERILGSVLGGALAAFLGFAFVSPTALLLLIFPLAVATMAFRPVNYTLFVFFLTPLFVLILDLTHPEVRETAIVLTRAGNTLIGGAIALCASLLLWPGSGANQLRLDLASAIEHNVAFACLALSKDQHTSAMRDQARRQAGLASNLAETTQQRIALESLWRPLERAAAEEVLGVLRRLAGAATTIWLQTDDDKPFAAHEIAEWSRAAALRLVDSIRAGLTAPPLASPPYQTADNPIVLELKALYHAANRIPMSRISSLTTQGWRLARRSIR